MPKVWIEAALNGPWTRAKQPGIPVAVENIVADGIACAEAGAAIIHAHAYDVTTGHQKDDWEIYARIIEGIRARRWGRSRQSIASATQRSWRSAG